MVKQSFKQIYLRNAIGVFYAYKIGHLSAVVEDRAGTRREANYLAGIGYILWAITLPLTITLGATIKSLIDFFSRKETSDDTVNQTLDSTNALDADKIKPVIDVLREYYPQSKSSNHLVNSLFQENYKTQRNINKEKQRLQADQLGNDCYVKYLPQYIFNLPLDEEHVRLLNEFTNESYVRLLEIQKSALQAYVHADHNRGKRTHNTLCQFFTLESTSSIQPATNEPLSENTLSMQ
ncbi:hypothetical protein [Legionella worsleiensis]|uniref:Uncharacterized protein n=1 Tax=Legionella worsleiensis TaxID=45076 RepID=A0A0W1AEE5_9GAMM|nr:hypothetical protein [Legionella worsleiensis]KTD79709.1 hypothetical protein Lwor_1223 [Legionella worsleiensis]STY32220.1 Uncharacterised protein [Legionella worsleiensis]